MRRWRRVLGGAAVGVSTSCAGVLELEPTVTYAPDEAFAFPTCANAPNRIFCDEQLPPSAWANAARPEVPTGGDRCKREAAPGRSGAGLSISADPSRAPASDIDGWCAAVSFDQKETGVRIRVAFKLQSAPTTKRFGILGFELKNLSFLVIELNAGTLVARPSTVAGSVSYPEPSVATIAPYDEAWHELSVHVSREGRTNIVFDGKLRASPIDLGRQVAGELQLLVLDSNRADVPASVVIDDVLALPY